MTKKNLLRVASHISRVLHAKASHDGVGTVVIIFSIQNQIDTCFGYGTLRTGNTTIAGLSLRVRPVGVINSSPRRIYDVIILFSLQYLVMFKTKTQVGLIDTPGQ